MNVRVSAAAALMLMAQGAFAATASISASVDWGAFTLQFLPTGASYAPSELSTTAYLDTIDGSSQQTAADWSSPISVSVNDAGANAVAFADGTTLGISSAIDGGTTVTGDTLPSYSPTVERAGQFTVTGNGILLITLPATASASVAGGNVDFPALFSNSSIELRMSSGAVNNSEVLSACASYFDSTSDLLTQNVSGVLVSGLNVKDGDIVSFAVTLRGYASVQDYIAFEKNPNPVPLPASLWLLAPALGGLGFMRRRSA